MGISLHQDKRGDDIYHSGFFSQGAAMFGISALIDHSGNDSYQASVAAQGLGSTLGAGALIDLEGADTYSLGGKYYHEPLMPLDFITLGQGMGLGMRPHLAGGLGLLYDGAGNDRYLGGFLPGFRYWYATGALMIAEATMFTTQFTIPGLRNPPCLRFWWITKATMPITAAMDPDRVPVTTGLWAFCSMAAETMPIPSKAAMAWDSQIPWASLWTAVETTVMSAKTRRLMAVRILCAVQAESGFSWMPAERTAIQTA